METGEQISRSRQCCDVVALARRGTMKTQVKVELESIVVNEVRVKRTYGVSGRQQMTFGAIRRFADRNFRGDDPDERFVVNLVVNKIEGGSWRMS
jgi:hypothetical protein